MYLKVSKDSKLFESLYKIFTQEKQRDSNYDKWMKENLPEFNRVLLERSPYELHARVVGWEFKDEVDRKVWQPVKGYDSVYEPNRRTKAGKQMRERIDEARGHIFNRIDFFDIFHTGVPVYGKEFIVPNGFLLNNTVYMLFDDRNYDDIKKNCSNQFEEITYGQFEEADEKYLEHIRYDAGFLFTRR